jgi:hypothetical protein
MQLGASEKRKPGEYMDAVREEIERKIQKSEEPNERAAPSRGA